LHIKNIILSYRNHLALLLVLSGYFILEFFSTIIPRCYFKKITNIPCSGCGGYRATKELLNGNFLNAIYLNPLTVIFDLYLIVAVPWLLYDIYYKKNTFFEVLYKKCNKKIGYAIYLTLALNWLWNILKNN
jgi:hypothetical protein